MPKGNLKSVRLTDDLIELIERQAGDTFTAKLENLVTRCVWELPEREKEIVTMRYGLEGRRELTQKEVAQHMGISQSYISRLEKRIMLRLRKELNRLTGCA